MLVFVVGLVPAGGCASDDDAASASTRRCTMLRDHLVELRLASAQGVDHVAHRAAMQQALGDDFVTTCTSSLGEREIRCALDATDTATATSCSHAAVKP